MTAAETDKERSKLKYPFIQSKLLRRIKKSIRPFNTTRKEARQDFNKVVLPFIGGGGAFVVVKVYVSEYGPLPASLLAKIRKS